MKRFPLTASVRRVVIDTVSLRVAARNKEEAHDKAEKALMEFPGPHYVPGVDYCYIENREHKDNEVIEVKDRS